MATGTGVEITLGSAKIQNIAGYTVVEDATPLDPSDLTGGFGQLTVDGAEFTDIKRQMGQTLTLSDGSLGETTGTVRGISGNGLAGTLEANSRLGLLAVERTIPPFIGTLTAGLTALFALCGITTNIVIDTALNSINVKLPGGRENVYDRLKKLTSAFDFEVSLVSNNVVCRVPRQRVAENYRNNQIDWKLDQNELAQAVSAYYYSHTSGSAIAYPIKGDVDSVQPFQVDAGEVKVLEIALEASLSAVNQPVASGSVSRTDMSGSKYSVIDTEGVAVDPALWTATGGSLLVTIGDDTRTLTFTLTGANIPDRAPFRLGAVAGTNDVYSTLRILGTGIFWDRQLLTLGGLSTAALAPDEMGAEVDNIFMDSYDQVFHRLLFTAGRYTNDIQTISVKSGGINRLGETGSARYPTIGDVATAYPGATITTIQTALGPTIGDWNTKLYAMVSADFANQAFGNINGARVLYDNCWYRIRSATTRPVGVDYTAERYNVVGDVYRTGETIAQWNARWSGKTIRDVNISPLRGL